MSLGNKINYFRQRSGLTQEQVAEQINVTRQTVSNWERGVNEPDFESLCRLSEVFGISLNDFSEQNKEQEQTNGKKNKSEIDLRGEGVAREFDGFALFLGVLIFFLGGFLLGGWTGWIGSFVIGGCAFLAISSLLHGIAYMRKK